jgi:hypothetical protein
MYTSYLQAHTNNMHHQHCCLLLQPEILNLVNKSVKTCFPEQGAPSGHSSSSHSSSGSLQEWAVDKAACATYLYYM